MTEKRSDALLLRKLQGLDLSQYTSAFVELPLYPASLSFIRRHAPHIQILTRPINAEFFHRFHYILANGLNMKGSRGAFSLLKTNLLGLRDIISRSRLDYLCAKRSDFILSITQWEEKNYWRYLTDPSKVKTAPYFLPSSYGYEDTPSKEKKDQCVCVMSTTLATLPFLLDAAKKFSKCVRLLGRQLPEWRFFITGDFPPRVLELPERVERTGLLQTPFTILAESRAMALLSEYGFGFKTKLLDAINYKCYVLVPKGLYRRLPVEVQPFCIIVDTGSVDSFRKALERCLEPYPEGDPNDIFRSRAFAALDELLKVNV
ncbi:MAG: glycosyltransferase [Pyrinomonadaceae bacterium]|nr:glycosyltransferase [Pyrinomonadaceae bacterium]